MTKPREPHSVTRKLAIAAAVIFPLAVLWWYNTGGPPVKAPGPATAASVGRVANVGSVGSVASAPTAQPTVRIAPPKGVSSAGELSADWLRENLAATIETDTPPWSNAATESRKSQWDWNKNPATAVFLIPTGEAPHPTETVATLEVNPGFADTGEEITATLTVWHGGSSGVKKEPANAVVTGRIEAWDDGSPPSPGTAPTPKGYQPVEPLRFATMPGGPGTRYVAKFTPSTIEELKKQRRTQVTALVSVDGKPMNPVGAAFSYSAITPVVVLDRHSDAMVDGSLEVTVVFDVKLLGEEMYTVTLFDGTGEIPIVIYEGRRTPTALGPQEVKFTFYGRTIALKKLPGPYVVRALHGTVTDETIQPPHVIFATSTRFTTNAYRADEFSTREWDSPAKQARINMLKRLISETEAHNPQ